MRLFPTKYVYLEKENLIIRIYLQHTLKWRTAGRGQNENNPTSYQRLP